MIRPVVKEDVEGCVKLGAAMHRESSYRKLKYDDQKVVDLAYACIFHPNDYLGLVEEKNGRLVGMFCGMITPYFFGPNKIASDLVLYVDKANRGGTTAFKMVKAYEDWALRNGADQIMLGVSTGVSEKRTVALYKRLGYKLSGTILKK